MAETVDSTPATEALEEASHHKDWGILRDISFRLVVEVGRARAQVRDILGLEVGSLEVTSKLSGEPMDISLDAEFLARAEIIIIKDKLWARVTKITREGR